MASLKLADSGQEVENESAESGLQHPLGLYGLLGNVIESHTSDSQGRASTSEVAGNGTERYMLSYVNATETDVTDALNHVMYYRARW